MRYTIIIVAVMVFFIWDGMYNAGQYLDDVIRGLRHIAGLVGLM